MEEDNLIVFKPNNGINCNSLNSNFEKIRTKTNSNESALSTISSTALKKDGSNLTQEIINNFNQIIPKEITAGGNISVADGDAIFLTLTSNSTILLPEIQPDSLSHTITMTVAGSLYSLNLGTPYHLLQNSDVDTTAPYSIMYLYNKLDNKWYYLLTQ